MERFVNEIVKSLTVNNDQLALLSHLFKDELKEGLENEGKMIKALPSFVYSMPTGQEIGKYLTVDLGGTNLRVGLVELLGNGRYRIEKESHVLPETVKNGHGHEVFDFIAEKVGEFLKKPEVKAELPLCLGFTFSFPVQQESLSHGKILGWSKEVVANEVVGMDAVELLQKSLHCLGLDIEVKALVNDTVGTLLAQLYRDSSTKVSVILGTGTNAAYMEHCSSIPKLKMNDANLTKTLINTEWGSFGEGKIGNVLPLTRFDLQLDRESKNPGKQPFEKMISGMYLGELFRLILIEAAHNSHLTLTEIPEAYSIKTKQMSQYHDAFISNRFEECRDFLKRFKVESCEQTTLGEISRICEAISFRSCCLCAAGISGISLKLIDSGITAESEGFTVAVDGSLYQRYPNYARLLQEQVCQLRSHLDSKTNESKCRVILVMADDLSSIGAAAAIAALNRK